ncbi:MAG: hypothetical protein C4K60_06520 [Ideonella sp. MAG2]|nr:MAG: hypothetical protein C4K60_06520 [Ideonella sp. MAG2]
MKLRSMAAAIFVAIAWPALAQPIDGRGGRFEDDLISNMEGRWSVTRQIRGTTVHNELNASWALAHQFLQVHMKDTQVPARYEALVLIGYVYSSQEYVAHWTDSFGAKFSAVGRGKRTGNMIEFRFEYPDGPFFNTFTWDPLSKTWQLRMESQASDGKRSLFAVDTLQRL